MMSYGNPCLELFFWYAIIFFHGNQGATAHPGRRGLLEGDLRAGVAQRRAGVDERARRAAWRSRPGSVSAMLKQLDELGLITHVPYRGVRLTDDGRRVALEVIRHHRLLESYPRRGARDALGSRARRGRGARARALGGARGADRGQARATRPSIPTAIRSRAPTSSSRSARRDSLDSLRARRRGRCSCACRTPTRRCCATWPSRGISPGDRFEVRERQPFGGPLFVRFGEREHAIGGQLARRDARRARPLDAAAARRRALGAR